MSKLRNKLLSLFLCLDVLKIGIWSLFVLKIFGSLEQNRYFCSVHLNKRSMKYSEFYRLIESYGWEKKTGKNKGTNHAKYVHPDFPYYIPVGRHTSQEVKPGTLNKMLKMAGIKK